MKTLREKSTFVLAALAYLIFHLRISSSVGSMLVGTAMQLLTTAPYCMGFTYILILGIRYLHNGKRPAWDRIARIYFTVGISFGFYFALYDYSDQAYQNQQAGQKTERRIEVSESPNH